MRSGPKCLVIGGNGFIGSHVVDELSHAGYQVSVFDRFSRAPVYEAEGVTKFAGDFLNKSDLASALKDQDLIVHALSMSTPISTATDPIVDVKTNLIGGIEFFKLAAESSSRHLYFLSTGGAIYGDQPNSPIREDATPFPVSPYAIDKLALERYLAYFKRVASLDSTVFRLSNPYGPRQSAQGQQGVIPIFLRKILKNEPITVLGDGETTRDYIFVRDAARKMVSAIGRASTSSVFNVGSGKPYSVHEVIEALSNATGLSPKVQYAPAPATFVRHVVLDVSRFDSTFGKLNPDTSLEEGIRLTLRSLD